MREMPGASSRGVRALAVLVLVVSAAVPAWAQRTLKEYEVKAAFLYSFVKFVQWPPSAQRSGVVKIGVVGRVPDFTDALEVIARGKAAGRGIVVRELRASDNPRDFHLIFIPDSQALRAAEVLERVRGAAVVTIGESADFLERGGIARFFVEANRVQFQINQVQAQQEGLKISSQLLSLASTRK